MQETVNMKISERLNMIKYYNFTASTIKNNSSCCHDLHGKMHHSWARYGRIKVYKMMLLAIIQQFNSVLRNWSQTEALLLTALVKTTYSRQWWFEKNNNIKKGPGPLKGGCPQKLNYNVFFQNCWLTLF